jgi:predicted acetyltransferase
VRQGAAVGIFNVATPKSHRGNGYGTAVTSRAVVEGFSAGAAFAYLQSSAIGESVYRRLGFEQVSTYTIAFGAAP